MTDILQEIFATISYNKLRTSLTGFAVAWGIFMLIVLLGAGNGLINGLTHNMDHFMANSMQVSGGETSKAYKGMKENRPITLDDGDIATTREKFANNVETLGAEVSQSGIIVSTPGGSYVSTTVTGVYPNEAEINKIDILNGRFINQIDLAQRRKVLVVDEEQAKQLSPGNYHLLLGSQVNVGSLSFEVVGISKKDESGMSQSVYAPFSTVRAIYAKGDKTDDIVFSFQGLRSQADNDAFEDQYRGSLNKNHDAAPDDKEAVWIWNRLTENMQMDKGMSIIRTALWVVGLLTLVSGIVGVGNIMLIAVKERTREFGIRKAIGAKPASILRLIIAESIIITTFFGYIGMFLGVLANQYMNATIGSQTLDMGGGMKVTTFLNPTVGLDVCVEATLLMIVAGTLAGLMPARKAAKVRPVVALAAE